MKDTPRGDAPAAGVSPSVFGDLWLYVKCPGCRQEIKDPFSRFRGIQVRSHVNRSGHKGAEYCKVAVVIEDDFGPPRVTFIERGTRLEEFIQSESLRLIALHKAREN